jgi:RHS repeat-associated protein
MDAQTQLVYMQQRYYDPMAGRFLSVDPVAASAGGFNRYWYANNNPYKYIDPDGRLACTNNGRCEDIIRGFERQGKYLFDKSNDKKTDANSIADTVTAPWGDWGRFKDAVSCIWNCGMPGAGGIESSLAAMPIVAVPARGVVATAEGRQTPRKARCYGCS